MNQFHQKRIELANALAAAGQALLDHTSTSAALAAIPNTEPQQYVVAGTLPMIAKVLPAESAATDWRPYHSALSRCAELLDNMKDGDPITEVPDFLAAKLKQCHLASQSQAAQPSNESGSSLYAWLVKVSKCGLPNAESAAQVLKDYYEGFESPIAVQSQAAPVAEAVPELTVWEGSMPESNGKSNFTAVLHRKDSESFDRFTDGFTIARSEYPDRVRYEADKVRWIIGERAEKPELWDEGYDFDKHSGYVKPTAQEVTQQAATEAPTISAHNLSDAEIDSITRYFSQDKYYDSIRACVAFATERLEQRLEYVMRDSNGPTHFGEPVIAAPVAQQAAKAETAEQAEGAQANVLPPTRGTEGQYDANSAADDQWVFDLAAEHEANRNGLYGPVTFDATGLLDFARAIEAEVTRRFRAPEGGNTSADSSDLAPTTSTVSEPEEIRTRQMGV